MTRLSGRENRGIENQLRLRGEKTFGISQLLFQLGFFAKCWFYRNIDMSSVILYDLTFFCLKLKLFYKQIPNRKLLGFWLTINYKS